MDVPMIAARQVLYVYVLDQHALFTHSGVGAHPFRMIGSPLASPLTTLKIRIVLSDEHVASLLP